jgi:CRP/FNR family transcriptional regulator, cyclic AMP receptor protein
VKLDTPAAFSAEAFLAKASHGHGLTEFEDGEEVFAQGDRADAVFFVRKGKIKITVVSRRGKEATVGILESGNFFGEAVLTGQQVRTSIATAMGPCAVVRMPISEMTRILHDEPIFAGFFIAHLLSRNLRIEEDLVDQLFNSSEKRLARILLLLSNYGKEGKPIPVVPDVTQEMLAEMVGTTRSRVSFFMNKFRRLGFISYNGTLEVHSSLLNIVLHD